MDTDGSVHTDGPMYKFLTLSALFGKRVRKKTETCQEKGQGDDVFAYTSIITDMCSSSHRRAADARHEGQQCHRSFLKADRPYTDAYVDAMHKTRPTHRPTD